MADTRTISQLEVEGYCRHHHARSVAVDVPGVFVKPKVMASARVRARSIGDGQCLLLSA
jgi:hypothetical protein